MRAILLSIYFLIIIMSACMGGGTASDVAGETVPICGTPSFDISNVSEYKILRIYVHAEASFNDYKTNNGGNPPTVAIDVPPAGTLPMPAPVSIPVSAGQSRYVSFVRTITSDSLTEITITMQKPITFQCNAYHLSLLEEDFYVDGYGY
jgi:hypothetical protein